VKAAMQTGKRAICAGPGNPPVFCGTTPRAWKRRPKPLLKARLFSDQQSALHRREGKCSQLEIIATAHVRNGKERRRAMTTRNWMRWTTGRRSRSRKDRAALRPPSVNKDSTAETRPCWQSGGPAFRRAPSALAETDAKHPFWRRNNDAVLPNLCRQERSEEGIERSLEAEPRLQTHKHHSFAPTWKT